VPVCLASAPSCPRASVSACLFFPFPRRIRARLSSARMVEGRAASEQTPAWPAQQPLRVARLGSTVCEHEGEQPC
jgi:hypothetical protein